MGICKLGIPSLFIRKLGIGGMGALGGWDMGKLGFLGHSALRKINRIFVDEFRRNPADPSKDPPKEIIPTMFISVYQE